MHHLSTDSQVSDLEGAAIGGAEHVERLQVAVDRVRVRLNIIIIIISNISNPNPTFRSRWMMPCSCRCFTPSHSCRKMNHTWRSSNQCIYSR